MVLVANLVAQPNDPPVIRQIPVSMDMSTKRGFQVVFLSVTFCCQVVHYSVQGLCNL